MTAGLLIGHGSPDPGAQAELGELRVLVSRSLGVEVGLGVLEFPAAGLAPLREAFARAGREGPVAAQPLILFEGLHRQHDLPAAAAAATRSGLEIRLGAAFGRDPRIVEMAVRRLHDQQFTDGDLLLFVGRGSSHTLALEQTEAVAAEVASRTGLDHLVCYTGISQPDLAQGMAAALSRRPRRILALPYLLHTGVLVRRVADVLQPLADWHGTGLVVLPHLGNAPVLVEVVARRLEQLM